MDIAAIAAFVVAAEQRSFTKAGHQLGITASGVSRSISRLEGELSLRLFNRSTRSISLTADGTAFYARCKQILRDLHEAKESLVKSQIVPTGLLRVSVPVAFGRSRIVPAVAAFMRRFPTIAIDLNITDRFVDIVEEGFDVAVRIAELPDSRLIARPLSTTKFVVCGSPRYLKEHPVVRRPEDLRQHECVKYVWADTHRTMDWTFSVGGKAFQIVPSGRLSVDNGEALVEAALCDSGLIYIQDYLVQNHILRNELVTILPGFAIAPRSIVAMYPQNRHLSSKVRVFVEFLIESFKSGRRGTKRRAHRADTAT